MGKGRGTGATINARSTCENEKGQTRLLQFPGRMASQNLLNLKRNLTAASSFDFKLRDFFFSSRNLSLLGCIIKSLKRKPFQGLASNLCCLRFRFHHFKVNLGGLFTPKVGSAVSCKIWRLFFFFFFLFFAFEVRPNKNFRFHFKTKKCHIY